MREYKGVIALLEKDLRRVYYDQDHDISYDFKECAGVVLSQFQRANGKIDQPDKQLYEDLFILYYKGTDVLVDPAILRRLVETLELNDAVYIEIESQALNEMVINSGGDPLEKIEKIEKMLMVLKLIKDFVKGGNQSLDKSLTESPLVDISARQGIIETNYDNKATPNEFLCPISLQLMQDPVIIASGQQLKSNGLRQQHTGAGEISLLSRRNSEIRAAIAEAGAIPVLLQLLEKKTRDPLTQEYALISLLNLSLCDANKRCIVSNEGIPIIIQVMKSGSVENREHGAAILFSLAVNDDRRGQKDASNALYNLFLYKSNIAKALRDGIVTELMIHIREPQGRMKDEALVLLDMIKRHHDAADVLDAEDPVYDLVNVVWTGSLLNQENAASVLLQLCSKHPKHIDDAKKFGVERYLVNLKDYGSDRGKKKARQLLEMITAHTKQRKRARTETNVGSGSGSSRAQRMRNM
ncbi:U-box domain-containing protein 13 [Lactuca sativa]|uniref:U-box domain-containing protein 13 n=1 Tax=Lactuca sativa TaxID=4236 RepID=UPI000CD818A8|nr:U-box domain-containing protein 13 [Lactuca sativa]